MFWNAWRRELFLLSTWNSKRFWFLNVCQIATAQHNYHGGEIWRNNIKKYMNNIKRDLKWFFKYNIVTLKHSSIKYECDNIFDRIWQQLFEKEFEFLKRKSYSYLSSYLSQYKPNEWFAQCKLISLSWSKIKVEQ